MNPLINVYKFVKISIQYFINWLLFIGWFHTGDKTYYDENGEFFIEGRLREIIKYRNHCISPFEIEEVLLLHPDVLEVTVVPLPHKYDGEQPMAYVKKIPGSNVIDLIVNGNLRIIHFQWIVIIITDIDNFFRWPLKNL